ncbi:RNA ligase RtcB family protein [Corallococcus praedator]|uniref:3'-phosphate/5'-hydroxy nucleic acid ligase n=1 Tax=Corallococcus praedator TaxID=2316724 RepID=A0ABX9Q941_9BACT|nr:MULTISPECIES: RNA ligase RtcB family protein [Corallococcus]RKH20496.1 RNA ligase RtcB family protein [Corallococcus sp. CA031C]RKH92767.1 RNA ligase RtcB family protein [Corallococcus praedator]
MSTSPSETSTAVAPAATVRIIASPQSWVEGEAVRQLEAVARLPGMRLAVGLPDLHPGKGAPVGAAFESEGFLYPYLVGSDIGCGMGLWDVDLPVRKAKAERWAAKLDLEGAWEGDAEAFLSEQGGKATGFEAALGTVGGGNHFAEVQRVETVHDARVFEALGLRAERLLLLVHSGSRGLGEAILRTHVDRHAAGGLTAGTAEARAYLERHDGAVTWARANRALVAHRTLEGIGATGRRVLDVCHNSVTVRHSDGRVGWLHRKGAAPWDEGPVVIPGSRGALSYLVLPVGTGEHSAHSLAHGAGRKWTRTAARERLKERFSAESLTRTVFKSHVVCEDRDLLFEEAPPAYKAIDRVVTDLVEAGLVRVVATLAPVLTYKTRGRSAE